MELRAAAAGRSRKAVFRGQYIDAKQSYDLISCCQAFCAYTGARGQETAMTADAERKIGQDPCSLRERAGLTQGAAAIRLQVQLCGIPRSAAAKPEAGQRRPPTGRSCRGRSREQTRERPSGADPEKQGSAGGGALLFLFMRWR